MRYIDNLFKMFFLSDPRFSCLEVRKLIVDIVIENKGGTMFHLPTAPVLWHTPRLVHIEAQPQTKVVVIPGSVKAVWRPVACRYTVDCSAPVGRTIVVVNAGTQ